MTWNTITTQITGHTVTAAEWNDIGENMAYMVPIDYEQFTSDVTVTATTEATGNSVVSLSTLTYEAVPTRFTFFAPGARPDNGAAGRILHVILYDSTTAVGEIGAITTPAASNCNVPLGLQYLMTPTAASHTYNVKAWVSTGTGLIQAGAAGSGTKVPGFLRAERVPT